MPASNASVGLWSAVRRALIMRKPKRIVVELYDMYFRNALPKMMGCHSVKTGRLSPSHT